MVSKPNTGRYVSEDTGSLREWIVRFYIRWREQQNIFYKAVETFS